MEQHLKIVAILNIVYRGLTIFGSIFLFLIAAVFGRIMDFLERRGELRAEDIPTELLDLIPIIFVIIGTIMFIVSVAAIIGSIGLMRKQEWGRILVIVVSFFNLIHIPLGTVLGAYSLWVLFNDEVVRIFHPLPAPPPGQTPQ